jgi:hypothetical protein
MWVMVTLWGVVGVVVKVTCGYHRASRWCLVALRSPSRVALGLMSKPMGAAMVMAEKNEENAVSFWQML